MRIETRIRINKIDIKDYIEVRLLNQGRTEAMWGRVRGLQVNLEETFEELCKRLKTDAKGEIIINDEPNKETLKLIIQNGI
jgi:hypothetical protein